MANDIREVLCRKWALEIIYLLDEEGELNYSQIEAEFETSSDVISKRLQELVELGVLSRNERSAKNVQYAVTGDGEELVGLLEEIHRLLD
jgi:DNA-binding HxlR family transcriptional regulator